MVTQPINIRYEENHTLLYTVLRGDDDCTLTDYKLHQQIERILKTYPTLDALRYTDIKKLSKNEGFTREQKNRLIALFEIVRRTHSDKAEEVTRLDSVHKTAEYMIPKLTNEKQEHFVVLYLNTKFEIIAERTVAIGTANMCILTPREVYGYALEHNLRNIICLHNHPSGDPTPSPEDYEMTTRLKEAGKLLSVELLDHMIIGDYCHFSLAEQGFI